MIQSSKWIIRQRRLNKLRRRLQNKQKYPYLKVIKFSVISKMFGYSDPDSQIRLSFGGHERFFERINDAVKEVVESLGGESYKRNHKYMKGNPKTKKEFK